MFFDVVVVICIIIERCHRQTNDNLEKSLLSIEYDDSYWQMCYVSVFDFTRKLLVVVVDVASR